MSRQPRATRAFFDRYQEPQGRWRIYGICLSDSILKKVYYANAARELGIHL